MVFSKMKGNSSERLQHICSGIVICPEQDMEVEKHSVEIQEFFCHSDFTCNQFRFNRLEITKIESSALNEKKFVKSTI